MENKFAEKLKELRIEAGLTQKDLADKLEFGRTTIASWELGKRSPDLDTLIFVAKFFNVTTDYLLGVED